MLNAGLYLHIPFCEKKCAYCDFYSSFASKTLIDEYVGVLLKEIKKWGGCFSRPIDTIYIGGGTPSLLGERIIPVINAVFEHFTVLNGCEITVETNPSGDVSQFLQSAKSAGVNRLSIGVQSALDEELLLLGRTHTAQQAENTVSYARELGFDNISLDLMLGLPNGNKKKLKKSMDFLLKCDPQHISAYILKIEENTRFGRFTPPMPDDEEQAEQYLFMCDYLQAAGYEHYEISNFAKSGYESRHNLKYWLCGEYLGIGPSAHSFADGKRFYYDRDLRAFLGGCKPIDDGTGGDSAEKIMLALRLKQGVNLNEYPQLSAFLNRLCSQGLGTFNGNNFALTDRGMLVSNSIITEILEQIL